MSPSDRHWTPVNLPDLPPPAGAYSPGVRAGNLLFVSGQTTIEEQTAQTLTNLARIVHTAGAQLSDIVSVTVYLADENDWGRFNELYKTVFSPPYPTRAVVGAQLRGILVEISAIAVIA